LRWDPPGDLPEGADFIDGMVTMLTNRDPADLEGVAIHLYRAMRSMERRLFVDADGELLIIPQSGALRLVTELGRLELEPGWVGLRADQGREQRAGYHGRRRGSSSSLTSTLRPRRIRTGSNTSPAPISQWDGAPSGR